MNRLDDIVGTWKMVEIEADDVLVSKLSGLPSAAVSKILNNGPVRDLVRICFTKKGRFYCCEPIFDLYTDVKEVYALGEPFETTNHGGDDIKVLVNYEDGNYTEVLIIDDDVLNRVRNVRENVMTVVTKWRDRTMKEKWMKCTNI